MDNNSNIVENENNDSILNTIKKLLGINPENTDFDMDIIIHINSVFSTLRQLGIGNENGYKITNSQNLWNEFIDDNKYLEEVKSYMYLKVRLLFDPPQNSFLVDSFKKSIDEYEWRFTVISDEIKKEGGDIDG